MTTGIEGEELTRLAAFYVVLGNSGQTWTELPTQYRGRTGKQEAIDYARSLLDKGWVHWSCVQGRGEPGNATPPAEVVVYRGAAPGYVAVGERSPFGFSTKEGDVERRPQTKKHRGRSRRPYGKGYGQ